MVVASSVIINNLQFNLISEFTHWHECTVFWCITMNHIMSYKQFLKRIVLTAKLHDLRGVEDVLVTVCILIDR